MEKITIYQFQDKSFDINPEEHNVTDISRLTESALPEALKNLGIALIAVIIGGVILYFIGEWIDSSMNESGFKKVVLAGIAGACIGLLFYLWIKLKAVFSSLLKPNLKTPEAAVKSFLSSLQKGLYKQAYNLLTDSAQKLGKQEMPKNDAMQKKMPDLYFEDLNTFTSFWQGIEFPWKLPEFGKPKAQRHSDSAAIVESQIEPDRTVVQSDEVSFTAKFVAVKRNGLWIVANGFFWPEVE